MSTYVIGDVQGCFDSLEALLSQLSLRSSDKVWLCGDLVNRGPKSAEVLRWAMGQGDSVVTVLGNHDMHLLSVAEGVRKLKKKDSFEDVLKAEDSQEMLEWLALRPFAHYEDGYLMVHAGLHPSWSIALAVEIAEECRLAFADKRWVEPWLASRPTPPPWSLKLKGEKRLASAMSILVGVRMVNEEGLLITEFAGHPEKAPAKCKPWFRGRSDVETVIFGHWAALGLHLGDYATGLDTGCVWGGSLTAIRLEDQKVFTQPALESV